jgi:hypothetical protein
MALAHGRFVFLAVIFRRALHGGARCVSGRKAAVAV